VDGTVVYRTREDAAEALRDQFGYTVIGWPISHFGEFVKAYAGDWRYRWQAVIEPLGAEFKIRTEGPEPAPFLCGGFLVNIPDPLKGQFSGLQLALDGISCMIALDWHHNF
jgi:hypothetical protein